MAINLKESAVEKIKKESNGLRGNLGKMLQMEHTGGVEEQDETLIKFHGMYQQDDRDKREERAAKKLERLYSFMIRLRLPGGLLNPLQWQALHNIAGDYSTGIIKITTRQTVQLHGIVKANIKPTIKAFNTVQLDSIAACGDVNRNVVVSAHPDYSLLHEEIFAYADKISNLLLPKTKAYYEVWLDEESLANTNEEDPLYQDRYLPRKFKIAIAIPPFNDVDVFTNDIGIIAVIENGQLIGFNIAAGGGMGTTHGNAATYPRLATVLGFVQAEKLLDVVYAITTTQRDFGNRSDRKLSRLKYTIDSLGVEAFRKEVELRSQIDFEKAKPIKFTNRHDDYGWQQNHKGLWYYTVFTENGLIKDDEKVQLKKAFYEVALTGKANFRFTCNQNIIISDILEQDKIEVENILRINNVINHTAHASRTRKQAMACVAFNTCPQALAEAQRYLPSLLTKIEALLEKHSLQNEGINIRMTGCPNGCARPFISEVGLVGTALGRYNMHLGADAVGTRLNKLYKENLNEEEILALLDFLFEIYFRKRNAEESFGDFVVRGSLARLFN